MPKNRYQRNTIVNYGNVPNYEAHAWGQVEQADLQTAKMGKDLTSLALKGADAIQENEAQIAGMLAGQQPDMKLQSGLDLLKPWASTFNKAALAANVAGVQNDIRANLGRMEVENQMDPDGYAASVKGYAAGLLSEVHPQVRGEAQIAINNYASRASTRILARAQAQQSKFAVAEIMEAVKGTTLDALNAARDGHLDIVETATKTYFATLDLGVEEGLLDPVKVEQVKSKFQRDTDAQIVLGEFGRTLQSEGIESAEKVIKEALRYPNDEKSKAKLKQALVEALLALNKLDDADRIVRGLKTSNPKVACFVFNTRGKLLAAQGKKKEALLQYLKTVLIFDKSVGSVRKDAYREVVALLKEMKDQRARRFEAKMKKEYP